MRNLLALALLASALGGCGTLPTGDDPRTGMIPVKTPVIERHDYVFDASTPDGYLAPSDAARLDAWFRSLELSYGDKIYVDGSYGDSTRAEVARRALKISSDSCCAARCAAMPMPPRMTRRQASVQPTSRRRTE